MKKCFIIDAMATAYRFYYAYNSLRNSEGIPTGVVYGVKGFIEDLVSKHKPDYLMAATDPKGGSFRKEIYESYKANRSTRPDDLSQQIPYFYDLLEKMNIPVLNFPNYEADDVIGTIIKKFDCSKILFYILSRDKDFMQLIRPGVFLMPDIDQTPVGIDGVIAKIGLHPNQFIDYLAIVGDTADNIPGVKGVGPKGAEKLLKAYGTLEWLYANLHNLKPAYADKLSKSHSDATLSKDLAKICCDVDLKGFDLADASGYDLSNQKLWDLYDDLEIRY